MTTDFEPYFAQLAYPTFIHCTDVLKRIRISQLQMNRWQ